ncbi:hypothetical protein BGZ73_001532 [Actinomortierella ambigua]|nr:hypothetical protein BGZ73_001532 [Actinomortierella ambigua]
MQAGYEAMEDDPIVKAMAQSVANAFHHPLAKTNTTDKQQNEAIELEFRLHSFLTQPKVTTDLYPRSSLQKQQYDRITVQERLVVLSVCEVATKESSKALALPSMATSATNQGGRGHDEQGKQRAENEAGGSLGLSNTDQETGTVTSTTASTLGSEPPKLMLVAGLEVLEYRLYRSLGATDPTVAENGGNSGDSSSTQQEQQQQHGQELKRQREVYEKVVYLAKVDTTGFWPPPPNSDYQDAISLSTRMARWRSTQKASPAQVLVQAYLRAMRQQEKSVALLDKKARARVSSSSQWRSPHHARTSLYVFARAQPQYLFAKSANNPLKRPLSDRGLVRWWKKMIEMAYSHHGCSDREDSGTSAFITPTSSEQQGASRSTIVANWHIPGIEDERLALRSIQHSGDAAIVLPQSSLSNTTANAATTFSWQYGPPDCVRSGHGQPPATSRLAKDWIPSFPDDPKSRLMQSSPSCRGGQVDLRLFWEIAAISEESGAGKTTGFFRAVEDFAELEDQPQEQPPLQQQQVSSAQKGQRDVGDANDDDKVETKEGITTATTATHLGQQEGDGISEKDAPQSLQPQPTPSKRGGSSSDYTNTINTLLRLNFSSPAQAIESTRKWEQKVATWIRNECGGSTVETNYASSPSSLPSTLTSTTTATTTLPNISKSPSSPSWIQEHVIRVEYQVPTCVPSSFSQAAMVAPQATGAPQVNTLSANFVKKKSSGQGSSSSPSPNLTTGAATVNILGAGLIKRKNPLTSSTSTAIASSPSTPPTATLPDGTTVNILGSGFIKKRKTDS